jgi:hypothetical protein
MTVPHNPNRNHLFAVLPHKKSVRPAPHLELVPMPFGAVYYKSGRRLPYVYSSITYIVSIHNIMADGTSAEIAGVGNEGLLGISLFMGGESPAALGTRGWIRIQTARKAPVHRSSNSLYPIKRCVPSPTQHNDPSNLAGISYCLRLYRQRHQIILPLPE